ncbi:MAG: capsule biosynthesis protein, partial [Alistipes sp.]
KVDISRRIKDPQSTEYSPQRSQLFTVALGEGLQTEEGKDFVLQPFDQVYIRKSPSYNTQNTITLKGEVLFAGSYALENTKVRVSDIMKKAGGVTPSGFIEGASLERQMTPEEQAKMDEVMYILSRQASRRDSVDTNLFKQTYKKYSVGFDLKAALDKPGSSADIILQPGDVITVPEYNGTVQIIGSVLYPNAVAFEQKKKLEQYVNAAGGYSQLARKKKVFVLYMNGTAATGRKAKIIPGCKIVVPMKSREKGASLSEIMGITSQTASMASIVASMAALFK